MNFFRYINEDYNKFRLNFTKHNRNNVVWYYLQKLTYIIKARKIQFKNEPCYMYQQRRDKKM